jgi:hypothetical protein
MILKGCLVNDGIRMRSSLDIFSGQKLMIPGTFVDGAMGAGLYLEESLNLPIWGRYIYTWLSNIDRASMDVYSPALRLFSTVSSIRDSLITTSEAVLLAQTRVLTSPRLI